MTAYEPNKQSTGDVMIDYKGKWSDLMYPPSQCWPKLGDFGTHKLRSLHPEEDAYGAVFSWERPAGSTDGILDGQAS
jgi:hypothetical protein